MLTGERGIDNRLFLFAAALVHFLRSPTRARFLLLGLAGAAVVSAPAQLIVFWNALFENPGNANHWETLAEKLMASPDRHRQADGHVLKAVASTLRVDRDDRIVSASQDAENHLKEALSLANASLM